MQCSEHPTYGGVKPPSVDCKACRKIYYVAHRDTKKDFVIASALGIHVKTLYLYKQELGLGPKGKAPSEPQEGIKHDLEERKIVRDAREVKGKYAFLLDENEKLHVELDAVRILKARTAETIITPQKGTQTSEATAVACLSDVHVGNHITLAQTNGINEYNQEIARERCKLFFQRVVRMTNKERQDITIDEMILFLGGDFIDGALHMDTIMSNNPATPMEQVVIAQDIIESGLKYLEAHGDFKRITIVCKDGNHGRITAKMHWNSRVGNSLEWYLYHNLAMRYPQFNWVIEESFYSYVTVYGKRVRFHHGDTVAFGGQNGFYMNMHRRIAGEPPALMPDLDVCGHLHQYTPLRRYVVNGCVVGYSPYAMSLQTFNKGEPPTQAFFLLDKKRWVTVHIPILLSP